MRTDAACLLVHLTYFIREEKKSEGKGGKMKRRMGIGAVAALGVGLLGLLALAGYLLRPDPPRIVLEPASFDWGEVPYDRAVTQAFLIKNEGGEPLEILAVTTSCGCTTARVDSDVISPGGTARLWVTFDPTVHEPTTGPVVRFVYLRTNDPTNLEVSLELHATLVEPSKAEEGGRR